VSKKEKFVVRGYGKGVLTDPKDIIYEQSTHNFTGLVSCISWAVRKKAKTILVMVKEDG